jgi:mannose-1-phosphate guanylyltransferase/mannose-6-phosphate isomerase
LYVTQDIADSVSHDLTVNVIAEPVGRNTAPAAALAVKYMLEKMQAHEDEPVLMLTSDHLIEPLDKFLDYMKLGTSAAQKGYLVTFGIKPTRPETGFGYIQLGERLDGFIKAKRFVEKPDLPTAKSYLAEGSYYWNSGMFAFTPYTFLSELSVYAPDISGVIDRNFDTVMKNFQNMPSISIDYAIMEKSDKVVVIPMDITWSDVGSWDSYYDVMAKNDDGNVLVGDVVAIDSRNSLAFSDGRLIAMAGMEDVLVVETQDAVLVAKKGDSQEVKRLVDQLKESGRKEIVEHPEMVRPWGRYKVLESGDGYKIKRVLLKPGNSLRPQMHLHRTEHWVVIHGTAEVTVGDRTFLLHEGESTFVPKGTVHILANPTDKAVEIIEVENGDYLEEDDIVVYDRT